MIENTIVANLLNNETYTRSVIPYLKSEYFDDPNAKVVFDTYVTYFEKYNNVPSKEAMLVSLDNRRDLNEDSFKDSVEFLKSLKYDNQTDKDWLLAETEKFCKEKDMFISLRRCVTIMDGKDKTYDIGAIPKIMQDSLSISFDSRVGHNYLNDAEARFEYYHREDARMPFDLTMFNTVTQGGLPPKSLTCLIGGTGTGKSLVMCHMAAAHFMMGKNVLYVTLELAEEEVSRRIDANLLDVPVQEVKNMERETFLRKVGRIKEKSVGTLTVKEYPTGTMNANHLRFILEELKIKQGVTIDVVYLDYINLCTSFRTKNTNANSYTIVKSIAEEMRGLAMEYDLAMVTATQPTRCLALDTIVKTKGGETKRIDQVIVGDMLVGTCHNLVKVEHVFPITKQVTYTITMEGGYSIRASAKHVFPTQDGDKSIVTGLRVGDYLTVEMDEERIVSIVKYGEEDTIDITVSGDHLFYANGILTHNSGMSNSDLDITDVSECIWVGQPVTLRDGTVKTMGDLLPGEQVKSNDGFKTVSLVHHKKVKKCYSVKLKSGKTIIVSGDHVFPTDKGRLSIHKGLTVGSKLNSKDF